MPLSSPTRVRICCAAATAWFCAVAGAAEFSVDAGLSGRTEYNDNLALRFDPAATWRFLVEPVATFSRRTETSQVSARARLGFNRYTNDTIPDTTDRAVTLAASQGFERSRLGLTIDYSELSSQSAQVLGQTGVNLGRRQVESLVVTPTWNYSISPRLVLAASAGHTATRYEQTTQPPVTDYRTTTASFGLTRQYSERLRGGVSVAWLHFDTSPFVSASESLSGNVTVGYALGQTIDLSATVGLQRVNTRQNAVVYICPVDPALCRFGFAEPIPFGVAGESTQQLVPFNATLEWRLSETDAFAATFLQRVNPGGSGALTSGFQANVSYSRALDPISDFTLSAAYVRSRTLGRVAIGDVATASAVYSHRLSEAWTFRAGYGFTRLIYPDLGRTVDSNSLYLLLAYSWPQWTVRR